jgi:hypothetical protein
MPLLLSSFPISILYPKAIELNLIPPTFNHGNPSVGKTILSDKLEKVLDYTFTKTGL